MSFQEKADDAYNNQERQATKFFAAGRKDTQTDKRTGLIKHIDLHQWDGVHGALLVQVVIEEAMQLGQLIDELDTHGQVITRMEKVITRMENMFTGDVH